MVIVELPPPGAPIVLGLKLTLAPRGTPVAERLMELLNPPLMVVVMVDTPRPFCGILREDGVAETVNPACAIIAALAASNKKVIKTKQKTKRLVGQARRMRYFPRVVAVVPRFPRRRLQTTVRSEEHTSELQSLRHLV